MFSIVLFSLSKAVKQGKPRVAVFSLFEQLEAELSGKPTCRWERLPDLQPGNSVAVDCLCEMS